MLSLPHLFPNISGDYVPAFASLPKIPRTPDTSQASAHRGQGRVLAPQFSQSEPQQSSRPGTGSSAGGGGRQSGGEHMMELKALARAKVWLQLAASPDHQTCLRDV